ncbi:hypothetical protein N9K06_01585 [Omnitrophica bacterium]|nr:hypothetical protein [Candidatus Omnitrophota bacterium]
MNSQGFLFTNVLQIPNLFSAAYGSTAAAAAVMFPVMFIAAVLHENFLAMKDRSDYTGLFVRALLVVGLMIFYERFFVWVIYGTDLLAQSIMPHGAFQDVIKAVFREITQKRDLGGFDTRIILTVLNYLTYIIALVTLGILNWLRFVFLALLYVIGPVLISFGIYKATSQGLVFWLRSLVAVSLWNVVLAILMKVISVMNVTAVYLPQETNSAAVIAANVLFILLFISVPLIAHQITSSGSISGLGTAVVGIGTAFAARYVTSYARPTNASPVQPGRTAYK